MYRVSFRTSLSHDPLNRAKQNFISFHILESNLVQPGWRSTALAFRTLLIWITSYLSHDRVESESNLSRGCRPRTVCWSLRPTPWWRLVSLLMHGSDLIDVSAPALHGCRRPFIVSTIRHGAVASRPWRRNELNEHFIFPDGMASKQCRCHYNRVLSIIIYL